MFNEQLTLSDGSANHAYSTVVTGDYKRIRRVPSTDLNAPELFTISHQLNGDVSRSLLRFDTTIEGTAGELGVISVQRVISIPRNLATPELVKKVWAQSIAFEQTAGYQDKVINLES